MAQNSGMVVRAERPGTVTYVDAMRILIDNADEYVLRKFVGLNERTCQNQKPIVKKGEKVAANQIIADGAAVLHGELALGRNVLVAFMTFDGYNFEDAIVINQKLVKEDTFTSIHIEEYDVEIRETKLGREEFTRDIPNVSERALANLDENGVVRVGTRVGPGDILVGKISPKSKSELTPEEKLLHAIFGRAGEDVKNDSLEMPAGEEGVVIHTQRFSRRMHMTDDQKKGLKKDIESYEKEMNLRAIDIFKQMVAEMNEVTGTPMVDPGTRQKVGQSEIAEVILEQIDGFSVDWAKGTKEARERAADTYSRFWPRVQAVMKEKTRKMEHMKRGDELPSGVLEMVKVYVATKRALSVGDKMAGRHGNKGVIARIVPEEDMPFMEDGTPVEIMLNPLGVPSRMNVGQILETHLGWAAAVLGFQAVTPVFDGATEDQIHAAIDEANKTVKDRRKDRKAKHEVLPHRQLDVEMGYGGKAQLYDWPDGRGVRAEDDGRLHLHDEAAPPGRRQDPRPGDRPVLADHPAAPRRQGPHRRAAVRRDGGLGPGGVRRQLRAAGAAHGQERRRRGPDQDLRVDGQGHQHARGRHAGQLRRALQRDPRTGVEHPAGEEEGPRDGAGRRRPDVGGRR